MCCFQFVQKRQTAIGGFWTILFALCSILVFAYLITVFVVNRYSVTQSFTFGSPAQSANSDHLDLKNITIELILVRLLAFSA